MNILRVGFIGLRSPCDLASERRRCLTVAPCPDPPGSRDHILLERVRTLLEKSRATANVHEADAFAAKAAEIIARHRLDPGRLDPRQATELAVREIPLGRGAYVRARLALLSAVVSAHDAEVVFGATPTGTIAYAAGHRSDLDLAEVGSFDSGEDAQQRGLARTIETHDDHPLPPIDVDVNIDEYDVVIERLGKSARSEWGPP